MVSADQTEVFEALKTPGYRARVERGFLISVAAYDWNCPQHSTPRFSEAEVETAVAPLRKRLARVEAELAGCRERMEPGQRAPSDLGGPVCESRLLNQVLKNCRSSSFTRSPVWIGSSVVYRREYAKRSGILFQSRF